MNATASLRRTISTSNASGLGAPGRNTITVAAGRTGGGLTSLIVGSRFWHPPRPGARRPGVRHWTARLTHRSRAIEHDDGFDMRRVRKHVHGLHAHATGTRGPGSPAARRPALRGCTTRRWPAPARCGRTPRRARAAGSPVAVGRGRRPRAGRAPATAARPRRGADESHGVGVETIHVEVAGRVVHRLRVLLDRRHLVSTQRQRQGEQPAAGVEVEHAAAIATGPPRGRCRPAPRRPRIGLEERRRRHQERRSEAPLAHVGVAVEPDGVRPTMYGDG